MGSVPVEPFAGVGVVVFLAIDLVLVARGVLASVVLVGVVGNADAKTDGTPPGDGGGRGTFFVGELKSFTERFLLSVFFFEGDRKRDGMSYDSEASGFLSDGIFFVAGDPPTLSECLLSDFFVTFVLWSCFNFLGEVGFLVLFTF